MFTNVSEIVHVQDMVNNMFFHFSDGFYFDILVVVCDVLFMKMMFPQEAFSRYVAVSVVEL